jgi:hypothetical protein
MTAAFSSHPPFQAQRGTAANETLKRHRPRWTRGLSRATGRLTQSGKASLTWRIIAGRSRPGEPHGLLRAWPGWEQVARRLWPVCEIPGAPFGLICFRVRSYQGEPVVLPDNTEIGPGAILGELHCNNDAILKLVNRRGNPFAAGREDLKSLSTWIEQNATGRRIEAFYARTILTSAAYRLGFTVCEKPITLSLRMERFFFKGLLLLYNQKGLARIQHGSTGNSYPADVWISRSEFLRLYRNGEKRCRRTRQLVKPAPPLLMRA